MDAAVEFAAVAVAWSAKGGTSYTLDTRPEATLRLGFYPNEQAITPRGLATVIGVNSYGHLFFELITSAEVVHFTYTTKEEYDDKVALKPGFRAIRTDAEKAFVAVAVEWTAMSGDVFVVDTRLEALHRFGLRPNERAITPVGLATIVGVSIDGRLLITVVMNSYPIALVLPFVLTNENDQKFRFRPIRTVEERAFMAVAVEWIDKSNERHLLDTRPGGALLPLGFVHNEQVISPAGLATVIGVNIDGQVLFEVIRFSTVTFYPYNSKEEFERAGFHAIRTEAEKAFIGVAVERQAKDGLIETVDIRPEATLAFGFFPNERVLTTVGLATIIGVNINGIVLVEVMETMRTLPLPPGTRWEEGLEGCAVIPIRTAAEKAFVAAAKEYPGGRGTPVVLLDSRPQTLNRIGFSDPNEWFYSQDAQGLAGFQIVGVDLRGNTYFKVYGLLEVLPLKYTTRAECIADGLISSRTRAPVLRRSLPAPHRPALAVRPAAAAGAPVVPPTVRAPAPVKTVTLSSGAVYRGAHTRAGQRHGNGTMRGADRSWRYKGQWQQGRPHGSGTLWMTIESGRGTSTEAFYEGRWVLGVPHGRGALRVDRTSDKRRYRGRWAHGRRAMTAAEVAAVRLSGGTALLWHRPVRTVPAKSDTRKRNVNTTKKKAASAAPARPPAAVVFATHDEVQRMVAVVSAACAAATGAVGEAGRKRCQPLTITPTAVVAASLSTSPPQTTIARPDAEIMHRSRSGVLRRFLLLHH